MCKNVVVFSHNHKIATVCPLKSLASFEIPFISPSTLSHFLSDSSTQPLAHCRHHPQPLPDPPPAPDLPPLHQNLVLRPLPLHPTPLVRPRLPRPHRLRRQRHQFPLLHPRHALPPESWEVYSQDQWGSCIDAWSRNEFRPCVIHSHPLSPRADFLSQRHFRASNKQCGRKRGICTHRGASVKPGIEEATVLVPSLGRGSYDHESHEGHKKSTGCTEIMRQHAFGHWSIDPWNPRGLPNQRVAEGSRCCKVNEVDLVLPGTARLVFMILW